MVAPYTPRTVYATVYAIPDFSTATVLDAANPYIVSSDGKEYSVLVSSVQDNDVTVFGGQFALTRSTNVDSGWSCDESAYDGLTGLPTEGLGQTITITAPDSFVLSAYSLAAGYLDTNSPKSWILSGSADGGATFTTIDTQTDQDLTDITVISTYSLPSNTASYTVYKLLVTALQAPNNGGVVLRQFNLLTQEVVS